MARDDSNLSIALRRTPSRQCRLSTSALAPLTSPSLAQAQHQRQRRQPTAPKTENQPKKRKRHSESAPNVAHDVNDPEVDDDDTNKENEPVAANQPTSKNGRPRRTTTTTITAKQSVPNAPAAKRRRHATIPHPNGGRKRRGNNEQRNLHTLEPHSQKEQQQIIRIIPLRAILDDRVKRRLRRNGLSEEMNSIYADRRQRRSKTVLEMERLREELAARDEEMERLREERESMTVGEAETSRLLELEREVLALRRGQQQQQQQKKQQKLASSKNSHDDEEDDDDSGIGGVHSSEQMTGHHHRHLYSWDMDAADAFSDDGSALGSAEDVQMVDNYDDEVTSIEATKPHVGNTSLLQKAFASVSATAAAAFTGPRRRAAATLTPPQTSPVKPLSPASQPEVEAELEAEPEAEPRPDYCDHGTLPMQLATSSAGVQASLEDEEKVALAAEVAELRTDLAEMSENVANQQRLAAGMRSKLSLAAAQSADEVDAGVDIDADGQVGPDLVLQMDIMLQNLAGKTAELAELRILLSSISSLDDTNAQETVRKLVDAVHAAREEMPQLFFAHGDREHVAHTGGAKDVLDTLLHSLNDTTAQLHTTRADLQTSRASESTLREKLATSAQSITELTAQLLHHRDHLLPAKESQVSLLTTDVDCLHAAVDTFRANVADLEATIAHLRMESSGAHARYEHELAEGKEALAGKAKLLVACEAQLAAALRNANELTQQLAASRETRTREEKAHGKELAQVQGALGVAEEQVRTLSRDKADLAERLERETSAARDAVACLRVQLLGALKMSEVYLGGGGSGISALPSALPSAPGGDVVQKREEEEEEEEGNDANGLAQAKPLV
ncbi:hypothetical protein BD289DRAFT_483273 [Coniella lustricola]|uniref:Uncharacterized protein n=1 Tax=Coniella lustricola TaxID=2025994 RepID=A0A2T3A687_9PEZI|nr:hypothetical protein BD289DRAFT_483273 [Coniella lustricola]